MKISVIGLGKLGAPMAAIFAAKGHFVIGVDASAERVQAINSRVDPVGEQGLGQLLRSTFVSSNGVHRKTYLEATTDCLKAVFDTDITFIVVATPSEANGRFGLKQVLAACEKIGRAIALKEKPHTVVLTSTVCPGDTNGRVREYLETVSGKKCGKDFGLAFNPEFIALGSVIHDFLNPDMVLIGQSDAETGNKLAEFYRGLCENKPQICQMGLTNAEITKLALNTFVTTKISYANMLARICENMPDGDVDVVTGCLGLDTRIGKKYLKGGSSFGGPCFPRDNLALMQVARSLGMPDDIPAATQKINQTHAARLTQMVESAAKGKKRIGVLGIAYKPGTPVAECSVGHDLVTTLVNLGYDVRFYDELFKGEIDGAFACLTANHCVANCDVVVLTIPCKEFDNLACESWRGKTLIDCWRFLRHRQAECEKYIAVGLGPTDA